MTLESAYWAGVVQMWGLWEHAWGKRILYYTHKRIAVVLAHTLRQEFYTQSDASYLETHLGHEKLNARHAQQSVDELLAHALEQVGAPDLTQVQVAQDAPPNGRWEYHQHLYGIAC